MISLATTALILAIVLVVLLPLTAPFERRFFRSNPNTVLKLAYYTFTIAASWALTAVAVWIFGVEGLRDARWPWAGWLPFASIAGPLIGALLAAYFLLALMPLFQSLRGSRWRRAYAKTYRRHTEGFPGLLPDTAIERFGFVLLGLTAGVCEEALYRGFLIRYLHEAAPALPLVLALAGASLAFGLAHFYQGVGGVFRTGLAGLGFGLLFLLSGSLIPGVVLHALINLQGVYVLRPLPEKDVARTAAQASPAQRP